MFMSIDSINIIISSLDIKGVDTGFYRHRFTTLNTVR